MLFVIDMQTDYIDKKRGKYYIKDSERMVEGIIKKIKECEEKGEYIYYTCDIPVGKNNKGLDNLNDKESIEIQEIISNDEDKYRCEVFSALKPYLEKHKKIKKSYYAIPTKNLLQFQEKFKEEKHIIEEIEFVGVETHICVLANAICIQSTFPEANIVIHSSLCKSKNEENHKNAINIMESLGMEIRR